MPEKDFDIYFLDIEMGKVSGMDIARHIREQEKTADKGALLFL